MATPLEGVLPVWLEGVAYLEGFEIAVDNISKRTYIKEP